MGARQSNISTTSQNLQQNTTQNRRSSETPSDSRNSSHNQHFQNRSNTSNIYGNNQAEYNENNLNFSVESRQSFDDPLINHFYNESINQIINSSEFPIQFIPFSFNELRCPYCSKIVLPDDANCHFLICSTKPRISYNVDVLIENKGECVICLEDLDKGNVIARLPCLCIYHKTCIDCWFKVNRSCPEHPS